MKIAVSVWGIIVLLGTQALGADIALKPPSPQSVAVPHNWTGFYLGGEVGGGWSDETPNYSPNDQVAAPLLNGNAGIPGQQPFSSVPIRQTGVVGGFELGYNWQFSQQWLVGIESDFSFSGMRGHASGTSVFVPAAPGFAGFTNIVNTGRPQIGTERFADGPAGSQRPPCCCSVAAALLTEGSAIPPTM
jgi:outer membrane immunogenic protein